MSPARQAVLCFLLLALSSYVCAVPKSDCKAKQPAPANLTCGVRGPYGVNGVRSEQEGRFTSGWVASATTARDCLDLCYSQGIDHGDPRCKSFGFDSDKGLCQLFYVQSRHKGFQPKRSSSTIVYDFDCFDCPSYCPQKPNVQLLSNGGFDRSSKYFGPWALFNVNDYSEVIPGALTQPGHNSRTAFRCKMRRDFNHVGCLIFDSFPVCSAGYYLATFDYSTQSATASKTYEMLAQLGDCRLNVAGPVEAVGIWRTVGCVYRVKTETALALFLEAVRPLPKDYAPVDVLWDNMHVSRLPDNVEPSPGSPSLLENGGFETGKFAPWSVKTKASEASIVSPGLEGSKFAVLWNVQSNSAEINIVQNITTELGALYMFSFQFLRLVSKGKEAPAFQLYVNDANAKPFSNGTQIRVDLSISNDVVTAEYPFYAAASNTNFRLNLAMYVKGTMTFDNFRVRKIASS